MKYRAVFLKTARYLSYYSNYCPAYRSRLRRREISSSPTFETKVGLETAIYNTQGTNQNVTQSIRHICDELNKAEKQLEPLPRKYKLIFRPAGSCVAK